MAQKFKLSTADQLIERLNEAGILPNNCRRFIIDAEVGEVPMMWFECYGDERLLVALADAKLIATEAKESRGERAESPPPAR